MTFHLTTLSSDRYDDYLAFSAKIYPHRRHLAKRFQVQVLDNPFLADKAHTEILLVHDDDGMIVGQFGLAPYPFHHHGQTLISHSGFDFYVLEAYRKHGIGKMLAAAAMERMPYFGIGATPVAERIYIRLGATTVGQMYRYLWLRSPLQTGYLLGETIFKSHWPRKPERIGTLALPEQVTVDAATFERRYEPDGAEDYAWSEQVLSFTRSPEFLRWRYFDHPEHYRLYALQGSQPTVFFVLRRYTWRGLSLLGIIDYRLPADDARSLQQMTAAMQALARAGQFDGIVVYSSLRFIDEGLSEYGFRKIGQPTVVVMKDEQAVDSERIARREAVLATMADCDQDFAVYD